MLFESGEAIKIGNESRLYCIDIYDDDSNSGIVL